LVKIKNLPQRENKNVSKYLHSVRDFERIGDHAENIMAGVAYMNEQGIEFSQNSRNELEILTHAVNEILGTTTQLLEKYELKAAESIEPLEEVIDFLRDHFKERQIARLKVGTCSVESGVVYNDIITDFERIADHCSNVAQYVIEELLEKEKAGNKFDLQEYMEKRTSSKEFIKQYNTYKENYLKMLKD